MPALPSVPDVVKLEFLWTQGGIPAANVLQVGYSGGPPNAGDLSTMAENASTSLWQESFYDGYPPSTVLVGVKATDLSSDSGAVSEFSVGQAGTYEGYDLPAQACLLANFEITRRYRGGHPRCYLLPPAQAYLAGPSTWNDDIISAATTALNAYFVAMSTDVIGDTTLTGPVNVSYKTAGEARLDPLVDPITGFVVSPILATQRRRVRASSY